MKRMTLFMVSHFCGTPGISCFRVVREGRGVRSAHSTDWGLAGRWLDGAR